MSISFSTFEYQAKAFAEASQQSSQVTCSSAVQCHGNVVVSRWDVTYVSQMWQWIPTTSDVRFSLEGGGGGFLALQGWIRDHDTINLDSSNITSLDIIGEDPLLNCTLEEVHDSSSLPPTRDELIPHVYDYNVVSSTLCSIHHPISFCYKNG